MFLNLKRFRFEYALRQPNATLFNKMLTERLENEEYTAAFKTKGPRDCVESLFCSIVKNLQSLLFCY
jgi:hypothetical protein